MELATAISRIKIMRGKYSMKKTILKFSLFACTILLIFADQIEDNKKRIQQIDNQVNKNNQAINKNKSEINIAKKSETATAAQVKQLDTNITKLQNEYNEAERKYREILAKIGINNENINKDIAEINKNTQIINVNKNDLNNKIRTWDKIRRNRETNAQMGVSSSVNQVKMRHDLKILFNKQKDYIQGVENVKKGVEKEKSREEGIRALNQAQAASVNTAKANLESKSRELNAAKKEKNKLIAQLRGKQATLNTENKKIEKTNSQLVAEKRKLNAQIQAIIQRAIRERELAMERAAEEKRKQEEAERVRREAEAQRKLAEERKSTNELSGAKTVPSNTTSTTRSTSTSSNTTRSTSSTPATTSATKTPAVQTPRGTGKLSMPINGSVVVSYGQQKVEGLKSNGIEIRGSLGQAVRAADTGKVIYSGALNGLGSVVIIDHGLLVTVYGNLSGVSVSKGANVNKGQTIGTLGRDQISRQPNLYFETRRGVNVVNPMGYL